MNKTIIELKDIIKKYKKNTVIDNLNISINQGEIVTIVGKSGCGKSTLLNIIGLIENVDEGMVSINCKKIKKINDNNSRLILQECISYIFQNNALLENKSVFENLLLSLKYTKYTNAEKKHIILDSLQMVGMDSYINHAVYELSGGEQQRIAIARAIIKPSKFILADEPTGNLDNETRDEIIILFKRINKIYGKTFVIVTHDKDLAKIGDREFILIDGKLISKNNKLTFR